MGINTRLRLFLLMLLVTFSLTGCGGGGAKVSTSSTTTGQELLDLDKAYKDGIITEKEYEKKKKDIMKR